jgi:Lung seven transmembrane receptor
MKFFPAVSRRLWYGGGGGGAVLVALWTLLFPTLAHAFFIDYDLDVPPSETQLEFAEAYIHGPGYIDLQSLEFSAHREYIQQQSIHRSSNPTSERATTYLDVAIFKGCLRGQAKCDWPALGVGYRYQDKILNPQSLPTYCCSVGALYLGLCEASSLGRLIVNETLLNGQRFAVPIHGDLSMDNVLGNVSIESQDSGTYVVLFANCNVETPRTVHVHGTGQWKSRHGNLPGGLYSFMLFDRYLLGIYTVLLAWYAWRMHVHRAFGVPIEKWILATILLGTMEMAFRTRNLGHWNQTGRSSLVNIWLSEIATVLKKGTSRCLFVLLSMGWCVVYDTLNARTTWAIGLLGAVYSGVALTTNLLSVYTLEHTKTLSNGETIEMHAVANLLALVVFVLDLVFLLWILDALSNTIVRLQNDEQQAHKLQRFVYVRFIFLASLLFAVAWMGLVLADAMVPQRESLVLTRHAKLWLGEGDLNYLLVLVGIAILWRPHFNARNYTTLSQQQQQSPYDDDGTHELELSTGSGESRDGPAKEAVASSAVSQDSP